MSYSYSQIVAALGAMNHISGARMGALKARLRHYQTKGFPPGVNTGKGRAASYEVKHAIKLALALECNQLGLSPDRAISILSENMYRFKSALRLTIGHAGNPDALTTFVYFDPSNLHDLSDLKYSDPADMSFHYAGIGQLKEGIDGWSKDGPRRLALIHVSALVSDLVSELARHSEYNAQSILADLSTWADDHDDD